MFFPFPGFEKKVDQFFRSNLTLSPKHAVILLGAGASVSSGCPLMKEFIDRGQDFITLNRFSSEELSFVNKSIKAYRDLKANFIMTEEDIDNIENLLSLADIGTLLEKTPISALNDQELSTSLKKFITAVITKSVNIYPFNSPKWYSRNSIDSFVWKQLVRAIAYNMPHVTVISLNYDCLLEYACHCMGVPFVYNREEGEGIEICQRV
jgi:hypothetical protein